MQRSRRIDVLATACLLSAVAGATTLTYAKKNGTQLILATCRNTSDQHWSVP